MKITGTKDEIREAWSEDRGPSIDMLIDGKWVPASDGARFQCFDPYAEQAWGSVPVATPQDIDAAVRAAHRAFHEGPWRTMPPAARSALLRKLGELIEANTDLLAMTQVRENGKLYTEMSGGANALSGGCYFFGSLGEALHGYTVRSNVPNYAAYTLREPIGVVAAITPWNSPLSLLAMKIFPALAAGNTLVIKPSEITPISTLILGQLVDQAGFPRGVVNIVTGAGPVGAALAEHPLVDKIAFTGSSATGTKIAKAAADRHARISLELGGKSPNLIFDDIDPSAAAEAIMSGVFVATGQACNAGSRALVQRGIYDATIAALVEKANALRLGDPLDPETQMGPLASQPQFAKVTGYFDIARSEGLDCLAGAVAPRERGQGLFVAPTVYGNPPLGSRLVLEEIFGPVVSLIPFDDEDDAVRLANDTVYGLASGVWTSDLGRAHRMIDRIRAGTVWVNTYRMGSNQIPFGGYKTSGVGREMGIDALDQYSELKSVWINVTPPAK